MKMPSEPESFLVIDFVNFSIANWDQGESKRCSLETRALYRSPNLRLVRRQRNFHVLTALSTVYAMYIELGGGGVLTVVELT